MAKEAVIKDGVASSHFYHGVGKAPILEGGVVYEELIVKALGIETQRVPMAGLRGSLIGGKKHRTLLSAVDDQTASVSAVGPVADDKRSLAVEEHLHSGLNRQDWV